MDSKVKSCSFFIGYTYLTDSEGQKNTLKVLLVYKEKNEKEYK